MHQFTMLMVTAFALLAVLYAGTLGIAWLVEVYREALRDGAATDHRHARANRKRPS